jgi:mono/diheme cytochrome c family protein
MFRILREHGIEWPVIHAAEMGDLMIYLQADPSRDPPADVTRGQALVIRKGCLKCHRLRGEGGAVGIELTKYPGGYESPVAWATAIWSHSPRMAGYAVRVGLLYPRFAGEEMGDLFAFLKRAAEGPPK